MPLPNDNELDRLSREAADQYDVEPGTSGWETLQKRLDEELPRKRRRGLFFWWLLAGVLLLGGGWLMWNRNIDSDSEKPIAKTAQSTNRQEPLNTQQDTTAGIRQQQAMNNNSSGDRQNPPAGNPDAVRIPEQQTSSGKPSELSNPGEKKAAADSRPYSNWLVTKQSNPFEVTLKEGRNGNRKTGNRKKESGNNDAAGDEALLQTQTTVNPTKAAGITEKETEKLEEEKTAIASSTEVKQSSDKQGMPQSDTSSTITKKVADEQPSTTSKKPLPPAGSKRKNSFSLTLLAGPDISNVKFSSMGNLGLMAGIQANYYFAERWSISTGLNYTKKYYKARPQDFTAKGSMLYYDIESIEGNCAMWDIPLNLRYDFSVKPGRRTFVSAGISSYLMTREDYDYYYTYNGYRGSKNWNTDSNSNYLFSVINLSVGREWQIGKKLSLQAEPYLKMPVRGIGNGNIRLNSYGVLLGLKYQFGKK